MTRDRGRSLPCRRGDRDGGRAGRRTIAMLHTRYARGPIVWQSEGRDENRAYKGV
jgi:hypothetical protein